MCTQEDKDKLGFLAVKKLHEKMDDDHDGQIEVQETKEVFFISNSSTISYKIEVNALFSLS